MTNKYTLAGWLAALPLLTFHHAALAQPATELSAATVVEALEKSFGVHPGQRRNHIKGTCASGYFVGTKEAAALSRSPLFSGASIPVTARFSLAGGNPNAPDTARSPRGLALEFQLPGGGLHHMTMLNVPIFGASNPQTFYENIIATRADPATGKPDPEKLKAFLAAHPEAKGLADFLASHNPPASYAASAYFGIHTFHFLDARNEAHKVRWHFAPQDGEKRLTDAEMAGSTGDFLERTLIERLKGGPARWEMIVALGEAGDSEDNPVIPWPDTRKQVVAGTLTLTAASPQKGAPCEAINFDPLVMSDGIAPSNDPVLRFRSPAYAVSFGKRLSGN